MSDNGFPESWVKTCFGGVFKVRGGSQPPKSTFVYEPAEEYIRLLQIRDFGKKPVPTYVRKDLVTKFCTEDDILIARYGASLGRILTGMAGAYNVALAKVIFNRDCIEPKYVFNYLNTTLFQTPLAMMSRSAQNGFSEGELREFVFPLPPLAEQKRIVAKIEELFSELEAGEESLRRARRQLGVYRQSLLKQAFEGKLTAPWRAQNPDLLESPDQLLTRIQEEREGRYEQKIKEWETEACDWNAKGKPGRKPTKPKALATIQRRVSDESDSIPTQWFWLDLGDASDVTGGLTKNSKRNNLELRIPYLRVANVYANELRLDEIKDIGVTTAEARKIRLEKGDLLIVEGNGSLEQIGRVASWNGSIENCGHQNHLIRSRCFPSADYSFVLKFLLSPKGRERIEKQAASTSGLHTLSVSKVHTLSIPLCSLPEQQEIVRLLDEQFEVIEQNEREIDAALKRSEALRQSILKKAFTGQLVPQDPTDEPATTLLARIREEREVANKASTRKTARKRSKIQ